ncbi:MAG: competence/damage-inducible protein A [Deltaproteobacteria bacterium]|nr:competence/damage-inducible protein A [Deltaproteobacteria bacterium]
MITCIDSLNQIDIVIVGNEIVSGAVQDENARYACKRLSSAGFRIRGVITVGDVFEHIRSAVSEAAKRSPFVIVAGGLGPTSDDITTQCVADAFNRPLERDERLFSLIRRFVEDRDLGWNPALEKLALLPRGARLVDPHPRACGYVIQEANSTLFFLPGVPSETRRLLDRHVIPVLLKAVSGLSHVVQRVIRLFGTDEASVEQALKGLKDLYPTTSIGYYPNFPEVHVSFSAAGVSEEEAQSRLDRIEAEIRRRLDPYVFGTDKTRLETAVGDLLRSKGLAIALAESCTGGLIGHRITSVPGSSDYFERGVVVYSNRAKMELLGIDPALLERHGAVSAECAQAMARGVRRVAGTDVGLSSTGIAGPGGGSEEKPVGTVYIGLATHKGALSEHFRFFGNREQIKLVTSETALYRVWRYLNGDPFFHCL